MANTGGVSSNGGSGNPGTGGSMPGGGNSGTTGGAGGGTSTTGGTTTGTTGGSVSGGASTGGQISTAGTGTQCVVLDPVPRRLWRLSSQQYSNSVRDVLGITTAPVLTNAGGELPNAFFADDTLAVNQDMAFAVYQATNAVLDANAARIPALAACKSGEAEADCAKRFAQTFGERAYRRPLDASEVTSLVAAYTEGRKQDFNTGLRLIAEAVLQSPFFLYRTEIGAPGATGNTTLSANEVAAQLAYFLSDSTPDPALIAAADSGALANADGITTQVNRLLGLSNVKNNITRVVGAWFDVGSLLGKTKDPSYFPTANADQAPYQNDLLNSTQRFIEDVLWGGGKVSDLLTSQKVFVNQRLAQFYGLTFSGAADQFVAVQDTQRAGMITQPGFLWARSDPSTTSIVHRGIALHNEVVCADPLALPDGLLSQPDIVAALANLPTERDKSNYRLNTNPVCGGCHRQIDPFALVLEGFDAAGRYRTMADGQPANPTGEFSASPSLMGSITGPVAFAQAVQKDGLFTACAGQRMVSYALGRAIRARSTCELLDLNARFAKTDGSVASLFREISLSSFMRTRAGGSP
jgi:hypothetical protein